MNRPEVLSAVALTMRDEPFVYPVRSSDERINIEPQDRDGNVIIRFSENTYDNGIGLYANSQMLDLPIYAGSHTLFHEVRDRAEQLAAAVNPLFFGATIVIGPAIAMHEPYQGIHARVKIVSPTKNVDPAIRITQKARLLNLMEQAMRDVLDSRI